MTSYVYVVTAIIEGYDIAPIHYVVGVYSLEEDAQLAMSNEYVAIQNDFQYTEVPDDEYISPTKLSWLHDEKYIEVQIDEIKLQ
jgi:hypothetical protein